MAKVTDISPRTAELALLALDAVLRRSRRHGASVPLDVRRAVAELHAVASSSACIPNNAELLSVDEAARRLGVSRRTVERRARAGALPANRVGRSWQIIWRMDAA